MTLRAKYTCMCASTLQTETLEPARIHIYSGMRQNDFALESKASIATDLCTMRHTFFCPRGAPGSRRGKKPRGDPRRTERPGDTTRGAFALSLSRLEDRVRNRVTVSRAEVCFTLDALCVHCVSGLGNCVDSVTKRPHTDPCKTPMHNAFSVTQDVDTRFERHTRDPIWMCSRTQRACVAKSPANRTFFSISLFARKKLPSPFLSQVPFGAFN